MSKLVNKIDFAVIVTVKNANPNGDPLNGNMPRTTYSNLGEISDVCIKRKIRNRLQDMGKPIFVQSDDNKIDDCDSLHARALSYPELAEEINKGKKADKETAYKLACQKWIDVRSFGQVFAFKGTDLSLGIRGPVSVHPAFSVDTVDITSIQITKSVNGESGKDSKASDTMGTKHRVDFGVYEIKGSINCQLAEKTGFSAEDADDIKEALRTLFVNDCSSARPDGSMEVVKLYWWKHNCPIGQYSSAKVHNTLKISKKAGVGHPQSIDDYEIKLDNLAGLEPEIIAGI